MMKLLSYLVALFGFYQHAHAYELRSQFTEIKNYISVLGMMNTFKTDNGEFSGSGLAVDFSHNFTPKVNMDISVSTGFSRGPSVSSSFTGLSAFFLFNVFSSCCDQSRHITVGGTPLLSELTEEPYLFQVGMGINQYFLNGSKGVYSSSGLGVGGNFIFRLSSYEVKLSARVSQMTSNDSEVLGTFLGAGLTFPL